MRERGYAALLGACCSVVVWLSVSTRLAAEDAGEVPQNAVLAILHNPGTPAAGAKGADVTLVEYLDYNCGFCKKLDPVLSALLRSDAKLTLVYKDWPILSETSKYAAETALAAGWQGKYPAAHDALMHASHLASHAQVEALCQAAGVDVPTLRKDRDAHAAEIKALLQRNDTEATALGIQGTPGLLVGRHLVEGVYDIAGLQQAVASARLDP